MIYIGRLLDPKNDYIFKRIFGFIGNEEITKGLISSIIDDIEIKSIQLDCKEILERDLHDDKMGILDVRAILGNSMQCNIEMQMIDRKNIEDRILYYWSCLYSKSLKVSDDYLSSKKTIIILFTNYEINNLKNLEKYMSRWHIREDQYANYILTQKLDIAIIEIPKYKKYKGNNRKLDAWVKFIDEPEEVNMEEIKGDKALEEAKKLLEHISEDEYEQELAFKRDLFLKDKIAIEAAGYDKGLEEGIKQGVQQGIQQGIQQGVQQGIQQGIQQGVQQGIQQGIQQGVQIGTQKGITEVAKRMLAQNKDIEFIIECTGLTKEEIENLR